MWLLPSALFLCSLPGCFSVQGPESVTGRERDSLTVRCCYEPGWEPNKKWWCRGANWLLCQILVETTGSQQEVKEGQVSIRDNQKNRSITVTMQSLRRDDEDTYWCGISKPGRDLGAQVRVIVRREGGSLLLPNNILSGTTASNYVRVSSGSRVRGHYILLVFVKVPILLLLVGAILWLKERQRAPEAQTEGPLYTNWSSELTGDTAP